MDDFYKHFDSFNLVTVNDRLNRQFEIIFDLIEKQRPELCTYLLTNDFDKFQRILVKLPIYECIYKVSTTKTFFKTEDIFCQVIKSPYNYVELLVIRRLTITKKIFRKSIMEKKIISIEDDEFIELFDKLLSMKETTDII